MDLQEVSEEDDFLSPPKNIEEQIEKEELNMGLMGDDDDYEGDGDEYFY